MDSIKINRSDPRYPAQLAQIPDPPAQLYCRGNLELLKTRCFSIVGSRKITPYGKEVTLRITGGLVHDFTIVSGLAMGVDAAAHEATLDVQGSTIAVLGSGIDTITPPSNKQLGQRILDARGLIISEYPPGAVSYPSNFPARNRIISGLSKGVLVIEADQKSGALITARCALEQNRDVFAVPGNIFSPRSMGPNQLLCQGARVVLSAQDILDEYQLSQPSLTLSEEAGPPVSTHGALESTILAILQDNGPLILDEIIQKADSDTPSVIAALSLLEIHGRVEQISTGTYKKCN